MCLTKYIQKKELDKSFLQDTDDWNWESLFLMPTVTYLLCWRWLFTQSYSKFLVLTTYVFMGVPRSLLFSETSITKCSAVGSSIHHEDPDCEFHLEEKSIFNPFGHFFRQPFRQWLKIIWRLSKIFSTIWKNTLCNHFSRILLIWDL